MFCSLHSLFDAQRVPSHPLGGTAESWLCFKHAELFGAVTWRETVARQMAEQRLAAGFVALAGQRAFEMGDEGRAFGGEVRVQYNSISLA